MAVCPTPARPAFVLLLRVLLLSAFALAERSRLRIPRAVHGRSDEPAAVGHRPRRRAEHEKNHFLSKQKCRCRYTVVHACRTPQFKTIYNIPSAMSAFVRLEEGDTVQKGTYFFGRRRKRLFIPAKARDYGITGVGLSVCLIPR